MRVSCGRTLPPCLSLTSLCAPVSHSPSLECSPTPTSWSHNVYGYACNLSTFSFGFFYLLFGGRHVGSWFPGQGSTWGSLHLECRSVALDSQGSRFWDFRSLWHAPVLLLWCSCVVIREDVKGHMFSSISWLVINQQIVISYLWSCPVLY